MGRGIPGEGKLGLLLGEACVPGVILVGQGPKSTQSGSKRTLAHRVVSGSRDATLRLWDIETGQCLHVLMGHVAAVRCVQYDGHKVVSGAYDYTVKVWDPESESCTHTLQGHTNRVYSLQVIPWLPLPSCSCAAGTRAMPVSASKRLSPHPMRVLQGHTGRVCSLQVRHSLPLHPDPHTRMHCGNTHTVSVSWREDDAKHTCTLISQRVCEYIT